MFDLKTLWQDRFQAFLRLFLRYMRLIGNSGFLFSLFLLIIFGSYYYSLFIRQIPASFPVFFVMAVTLTVFLARSPIRTFLKRADLVFLIAAEARMKPYFMLSVLYNFIVQAFVVLLVAIVLAPLYESRIDDDAYSYSALIALFILVKLWNIIVHWFVLRLQMDRDVASYTGLRTAASFALVYLALKGASSVYLLALAIIVIVFLLYVYFSFPKQHLLKWERLVEIDEALLLRFYRIVNAFTDVPALKQKVKRRRWAEPLAKLVLYRNRSVPLFLYARAFFRAGDYFGIYVRLLVLGALVLTVIPAHGGRYVGYFLFLYMAAVQLVPLARHFSGLDMLKVYPISSSELERSFQRLHFRLLVVLSVVYSAVLWIAGLPIAPVALLVMAGLGFSYGYVRFVAKKQGEAVSERGGQS